MGDQPHFLIRKLCPLVVLLMLVVATAIASEEYVIKAEIPCINWIHWSQFC